MLVRILRPTLRIPHRFPSRAVATAMNQQTNEFSQPIGAAMDAWTPPLFPPHVALTGQYCTLEPLEPVRHGREFWEALGDDYAGGRWTYLPYGPFSTYDGFHEWIQSTQQARDPQFYAVVVDGRCVGIISYLRITPAHGVMEIGHVHFSPLLAQTRAATETMYLLMQNVFNLGYRRCEWKCDSLNQPSRAAAARFGFSYEGLFRQAVVYKNRSRDTSWFAVVDVDWKGGLGDAYQQWLRGDNFDQHGKQKRRLSELTAPFVHANRVN